MQEGSPSSHLLPGDQVGRTETTLPPCFRCCPCPQLSPAPMQPFLCSWGSGECSHGKWRRSSRGWDGCGSAHQGKGSGGFHLLYRLNKVPRGSCGVSNPKGDAAMPHPPRIYSSHLGSRAAFQCTDLAATPASPVSHIVTPRRSHTACQLNSPGFYLLCYLRKTCVGCLERRTCHFRYCNLLGFHKLSLLDLIHTLM